ncbi:MAG: hypothetical protein AABX00_00430 [Nanoarchaeota archaeon]
MTKQVAIVDADIGYGVIDAVLDSTNPVTTRFRQADQALSQLRTTKYDLILARLRMAPGLSPEPALNDLWRGSQGDYAVVCEYFLSQIRDETSANKETPIIVMDVVAAEGDRLFPNAARRVIQAGANDYVETRNFPELERLIIKYIGEGQKPELSDEQS